MVIHSKRKQLEYDKQLEKYKHFADKKNYVSKVRFDAEFATYRELSQAFSEAIDGVHIIIPDRGGYYPDDKEKRVSFEISKYKTYAEPVYNAQRTLFANAPFISRDICDKFNEILDLLEKQGHAYDKLLPTILSKRDVKIPVEDVERTALIEEKFSGLMDEIRDYLSKLEILEEK